MMLRFSTLWQSIGRTALLSTFAQLALASEAMADESFQIREIQKYLNYLGYDVGVPDGLSGPRTKDSTKSYASKLADPSVVLKADSFISFLREEVSPADINFPTQGTSEEFVLSESSLKPLVRYLYPIDLNDDGVDELVIAGFESQAQKHIDIAGARIGIFEWQGSNLVLVTDKWLADDEQLFPGVGDIVSGDFNGDGLLDLFTSAYSDSETEVDAYALYNEGDTFRRQAMDSAGWQHGATSADINDDGYTDVFAAGYEGSDALYLGSDIGLERYSWTGGSYAGGSGAAFGNFLSMDSVELVIVDNAQRTESPDHDTNLYRVILDAPTKAARLEKIASLPRPILERRDWDSMFSVRSNRSHDIRAKSVDFDADGLLDVLVFSTSWPGTTTSHGIETTVQFLRNAGGGNFVDVTDEKLLGINFFGSPSYAPVIRDLDRDGDLDIFLSGQDFSKGADSTDILLNDSQGRFISIGSQKLSEAVPSHAGEDVATVLRGPNERMYIVVHTETARGYGGKDLLRFFELEVIPKSTL